jgi:hypothetical protein
MRRTEIYILAGVLTLILTLGLTTNLESFADNMLASSADLILSVFVAFYIVDRITRRERKLKWQRVKALCYRSIESIADLIMFALETYPGIDMRPAPSASHRKERGEPTRLLHQAFLSLAEEITRNVDDICTGDYIVVDPTSIPGRASAMMKGRTTTVRSQEYADRLREEQQHRVSSATLLSAVQEHFEKLSLYIFPRIMELDEQEDLVASFMDVESAYQEWTSTVDIIEGDWGMPEQYAWGAVAEFCARMGAMLKIVHFAETGSSPKHNLEAAAIS